MCVVTALADILRARAAAAKPLLSTTLTNVVISSMRSMSSTNHAAKRSRARRQIAIASTFAKVFACDERCARLGFRQRNELGLARDRCESSHLPILFRLLDPLPARGHEIPPDVARALQCR